MNPDAASGKLHRALADEHRIRIVDELRRAPRGLDVQQFVERLGLHANTIRWHLGVLEDAGIVASGPESRGTPGRPRIIYTLSNSTDADESQSYRLLATILIGALDGLDGGSARAEAVGREWGSYLVRRPPGTPLDERAALDTVAELLAQQGFRPEVAGTEIRMHRCPYGDLAPGLVCAAHQGLVDGALAELRSGLLVDRLEPFAEPGLCVVALRRRASRRPR